MARGSGYQEGDGMEEKAVTNYCRLRGGKGIGKWWGNKIGRTDDAVCPRCREEEQSEEQSPDQIMFWCIGIKKMKDTRGRREWVEENDMR